MQPFIFTYATYRKEELHFHHIATIPYGTTRSQTAPTEQPMYFGWLQAVKFSISPKQSLIL